MKTIPISLWILVVLATMATRTYAAPPPTVENNVFNIYSDQYARDNHFFPSGWFGDYNAIKLNTSYKLNAHNGATCIQFIYTPQGSSPLAWAGVYWQNPANNWGEQKGGYDLRGKVKLTFWARGENGTEVIDKFIVGGIQGAYPDSATTAIGPIKLSNEWQSYTIDLTNKDLSYINGGFAWVTNADLNPQGITFYLDDIRFE